MKTLHTVGRLLNHYWLYTIAGVVFLSRLPFLATGYGDDPDAWRVALAARYIAATGHYQASRFPGYPLPELIYACIGNANPLVFNSITALLSVIASVLFAAILRYYNCRNVLVATLAFAFTPIVFISSTTAMDYLWALAFALGSFYAVLHRKVALAGLLLGLATGCRLTSIMLVVPFSLLLVEPLQVARSLRYIVLLHIIAVIVACTLFIPVLLTYGTSFLTFYQSSYPTSWLVFYRATIRVWGVIGCGAFLVAGVALFVQQFRATSDASTPFVSKLHISAWFITLILYSMLFIRLPDEPAYLIPIVPFVLLLLSHIVLRSTFVTFCILLAISPWFLSVDRVQNVGISSNAINIIGQLLYIDVSGPIFNDQHRRQHTITLVQDTLTKAAFLPQSSVIIAGDWFPFIQIYAPHDKRYVYLLDVQQVQQQRERGEHIFYLPDVPNQTAGLFGYDLATVGAQPILP